MRQPTSSNNPIFAYSAAGLALTKSFEGLCLSAYKDVVGVLTIGFGHTGPDVHPGLIITEQQADALLEKDIQKCVDAVNKLVKVPITQGQGDALTDFSFNLGIDALTHSTLLKLLNVGDYAGAAMQFARWDHAGIEVNSGLVRRRAAETALFLEGV